MIVVILAMCDKPPAIWRIAGMSATGRHNIHTRFDEEVQRVVLVKCGSEASLFFSLSAANLSLWKESKFFSWKACHMALPKKGETKDLDMRTIRSEHPCTV